MKKCHHLLLVYFGVSPNGKKNWNIKDLKEVYLCAVCGEELFFDSPPQLANPRKKAKRS